jgi:hypothetical protein
MMSLRRLCFTLACLLFAHTGLALVDKELLKTYKVAKKYYAASDYAAAKAMLAPLIKVEEKNDITPYALFYYALSAYYNEEPALAESIFTSIVEEHSDWEQQDEVWYWLGQLRFEAKDYSAGLDRLVKITDKTFDMPLRQMKVYFLRQLDDVVTLQKLFKQYPEDQDIARVLFDKVAHQPLVSRDLDLLNTLACDFHLSLEEHGALKETVSLKKDSYNVGVFFPFFVDEVDYEEESSNLFVIALYQGIKAAVTELANQGININLIPYDTKKDLLTTAALLEQEEVKSMDLIIGPLYEATISLAANFARTYQINLFNPLSENIDVVGDNPFVFLFKSSLETQASRAAEFTLQNSDDGLNVGIVYGTAKADIIQAHTYKQCIEHSTGKEVALMLSVAPEEAQSFLNTLKEASEDVHEIQTTETKEVVSLDDLTHIYVASKDELIVANMLSAVATLKHPPHIIGHAAWLNHSSFTFDQLQQHRLSLVAPDHIDYERAGIHRFRSSFYDHFAQYPTTYACTGYEMMLFLGHMLAQHGVYFQKHWTQELYKGVIFEGVAYGMHHDNQHVPIVQYKKGRFVICNQEVPGD